MIVGFLLETGIFPNANFSTDLNESTPIQVATKHGFFEVVQMLIEKDPLLKATITFQKTKQTHDNLLYLAIKSKNSKLVQLISSFFVKDDRIDDENPISGLTCFMLSALSNLQQIAIFLKNECLADINYRNKFSETALHIALRKNFHRAIKFLLKLGCRTDIPNGDGLTFTDLSKIPVKLVSEQDQFPISIK
jgi:ankyrin repeat protein